MFTVETLANHFLTSERCDKCGAQAHMRVILRSGTLLFCAHHGTQHHAKLAQVAVHIEVDN